METSDYLSQIYADLFFNELAEASPEDQALVEKLLADLAAGTSTFAEAQAALVEAAKGTVGAIGAAYQFLTGALPIAEGFEYLLAVGNNTNFGRFNVENRYINQFNNLAQGNPEGMTKIASILAPEQPGDSDLVTSISNFYDEIFDISGAAREAALGYLTRPEALAFYRGVAHERVLGSSNPTGLSPDQAAAVVALGSIVEIAVRAQTPGIGSRIAGFLETLAANAAPTIIYTGLLAERYADGTASIGDNNYLDSPGDNPTTIFVGGGSELRINADFILRGEDSGVTVSGSGSTLTFNDDFVSIAGGPGSADSSFFTVSSGGSAVVNGDIAFAERRVFRDGQGSPVNEVGGATSAVLDIVNGGQLTIRGFANFAAYFPDATDLNDGTETAEAAVNVSRSELFFGSFAQFGVTGGGTATLSVTDGGTVAFAAGASFGNAVSGSGRSGGHGSLSLAGSGSRVVSESLGIEFARGEGSSARLAVSDGATLEAKDYLLFGLLGGEAEVLVTGEGSQVSNANALSGMEFGSGEGSRATAVISGGGLVRAVENIVAGVNGGAADLTIKDGGRLESIYLGLGRNGGQADVIVDGGVISLQGLGAQGYGPSLLVGRDSSATSTLAVMGGGNIIIDGGNNPAPIFELGRGAAATATVSGAGSSLVVTGGGREILDPLGFTGEAAANIGRQAGGNGALAVTDGALFQLDAEGTLNVGGNTATGSLVIDGRGSAFIGGADARIGENDGDGSVTVSGSAGFSMAGEVSDGDIDIQIFGTGRFTVAESSVRGDVLAEGRFTVAEGGNTLDGDLTLTRVGVLDFDISGPRSTTALLTTTGEMMLDGVINIDVLAAATLAAGDFVVLIDADGGFVAGTNLDVAINGLNSSLDAQVVLDSGTAMLLIGAADAFAQSLVIA